MMQPTDAVKLLYQAAFGPGHMVSDCDAALARIIQETESVTEFPKTCDQNAPYEEIGGGYVRAYLLPRGIPPIPDNALYAAFDTLLFTKSASDTSSRKVIFLESLDILRRLTDEGIFNFTSAALQEYLENYIAAGMPPVSHSEEYRNACHPAYRVIRREYFQLQSVLRHIFFALSASGKSCEPLVCFIDGMCGSGKSTLAELLADLFDARVIHMDDFFLPPDKRTPERLSEPGGNVDYERFRDEVTDHLYDESLTYGVFDCSKMKITSTVTLPKKPLTIIEGSYSCHPYFEDGKTPVNGFRIYTECSPDEQKRRILERNGEEMLRMFVSRWIPMEQKYSDAFAIRDRADYIIRT
ncbi:MAG: hypothetical protein IJC71_03950 [Clostridia bacterium]|nr:hypothetical protein [Clostridia bacterium]